MRKHNGMRPQDVVVLAKLAIVDGSLSNKELSEQLHISQSEVSESLNRSSVAMLIDHSKKNLNRIAFLEFIQHGLKYVFPVSLGSLQRGYATAHAHPFIKEHISSDINYVWPDAGGNIIGLTIEPLYANQTQAIKEDGDLYKILALFDVLRVGKIREKNLANAELERIIMQSDAR